MVLNVYIPAPGAMPSPQWPPKIRIVSGCVQHLINELPKNMHDTRLLNHQNLKSNESILLKSSSLVGIVTINTSYAYHIETS